MGIELSIKVGEQVPPLIKTMTQEAINLFEGSSGRSGPSQFTDETTARETLGTSGTVASGRMSLTFGLELLRRYFTPAVYNRSGMVDLRFLRPVRPGDVITFEGKVSNIVREAGGNRVSVEVSATNQRGDTTGIGMGSCVVPSGMMPDDQ